LAATVPLLGYQLLLHLIVNAYWEPLEFELPPLDDLRGPWRRCVDTYFDPPNDICEWVAAKLVPGQSYRAEPRSVVLLLAQPAAGNSERQ
jgi:glycogen operon protein